MEISGNAVFITGGASGLGAATLVLLRLVIFLRSARVSASLTAMLLEASRLRRRSVVSLPNVMCPQPNR